MRKTVMLAAAATLLAGSAFAAPAPQTFANARGEPLSQVPYEPQLPYVKEASAAATATIASRPRTATPAQPRTSSRVAKTSRG
jgi:hypothetical protein